MTEIYCDLSLIKTIIPHRDPFLFVDRVVFFQAAEKIVAEKFLAVEAPFFRGHFPGKPIMPGVLVTEALAQASGLLMGLTWHENRPSNDFRHQNLYLASVDMKFVSPAQPEETLRLTSTLQKRFGNLARFSVHATAATRSIATGRLALGLAIH
jgi:3-hydroxyacyl-[acyl-carrier-protein] dehydratase